MTSSSETLIRQTLPNLSTETVKRLVPLCDEVEAMENRGGFRHKDDLMRLAQIADETVAIVGQVDAALIGLAFLQRRRSTRGSA